MASSRFHSSARASMLVRVFPAKTVRSSWSSFYFQGDPASSETLARFLRLFSRHGGNVSSPASGADRPLPGAVPSFRAVCRGGACRRGPDHRPPEANIRRREAPAARIRTHSKRRAEKEILIPKNQKKAQEASRTGPQSGFSLDLGPAPFSGESFSIAVLRVKRYRSSAFFLYTFFSISTVLSLVIRK